MSKTAIQILGYNIRKNKAYVAISEPFEESEDELDPLDDWTNKEVSMIYTIGVKAIYDQLFKDLEYPKKRGFRLEGENPRGGSVWRNYNEAREVAVRNSVSKQQPYNVYGVIANWKVDTIPNSLGYPWHDLLFDSFLVKLDAKNTTST